MTGIITTAVTGVFLLQAITPQALALGTTTPEVAPTEPTYETHIVKMTAYNAVPGQTDSTPDRTSIGAYTDPDIVAARSSDLADELPYGTVIEVVPVATSTKKDVNCGREVVQDQIGLRVIADAMNPRIHNTIDILLDSHKTVTVNGKKRNPAKAFGMCKNVTIKVLGHIDTSHMPKDQDELKLALDKVENDLSADLAINLNP